MLVAYEKAFKEYNGYSLLPKMKISFCRFTVMCLRLKYRMRIRDGRGLRAYILASIDCEYKIMKSNVITTH